VKLVGELSASCYFIDLPEKWISCAFITVTDTFTGVKKIGEMFFKTKDQIYSNVTVIVDSLIGNI